MVMFFLLLIVAAVAETYASLAYTQEKLGGPEADELGVGIAMILLGLSVFGFSGDIVLTRELFWLEEPYLVYYFVRYGALLLALIGIVKSLSAVYKRTTRLEMEIKELRQREKEAQNRREK